MSNQNHNQVMYRWLGAAGIELHLEEQSLLIDPYVTRVPWHHMFFQNVQSNRRLVNELIKDGDHILVTHAHIDHLLDVSTVMELTGASVYGSQNTCHLLRALGAEGTKIHLVEAGDQFTLGVFQVSTFPARHFPVPGFMPGIVPVNTKPPRTARQYRMDCYYSFLIEAGGLRIFVDSGTRESLNLPADILIIHPFYRTSHYRKLLAEVEPKLVIPNHWDNFMPSFSREINQVPYPKDWVSFLVRRMVLPRFSKTIRGVDSNFKVLVPQLFQEYDLYALID